MKKLKCAISEVELIENDVLHIDIEREKSFEIEDFQELKEAAKKIGNGKRFYNLITVGEFTLPSREAREASCSHEGSEFKKADAFVIKSLPQKIIANFMIKVNRPTVPTKYFDSVEAAKAWISSLKSKESRKLMLESF
mgnify:CR=1 FL=1